MNDVFSGILADNIVRGTSTKGACTVPRLRSLVLRPNWGPITILGITAIFWTAVVVWCW